MWYQCQGSRKNANRWWPKICQRLCRWKLVRVPLLRLTVYIYILSVTFHLVCLSSLFVNNQHLCLCEDVKLVLLYFVTRAGAFTVWWISVYSCAVFALEMTRKSEGASRFRAAPSDLEVIFQTVVLLYNRIHCFRIFTGARSTCGYVRGRIQLPRGHTDIKQTVDQCADAAVVFFVIYLLTY